MNLETGKKILRIAGILSIIGGVITLIFAILGIVGGGSVASNPEIGSDAQLQQNAGLVIAAGLILLVSGLLGLADGIISYRAGKYGKKSTATAAIFFAVLTAIGQVANIVKSGVNGGSIYNLVISALVIYSAFIVRKNAEA